jgi:hypothetical protein
MEERGLVLTLMSQKFLKKSERSVKTSIDVAVFRKEIRFWNVHNTAQEY